MKLIKVQNAKGIIKYLLKFWGEMWWEKKEVKTLCVVLLKSSQNAIGGWQLKMFPTL